MYKWSGRIDRKINKITGELVSSQKVEEVICT